MRTRYKDETGRAAIQAWCIDRLDAWQEPHQRAQWRTAAGLTHLVFAGTGPGTVVYLPGTNFNAATSLVIASAVAAKTKVVVVDLPGQPGLSDPHRPVGQHLSGYGAWLGEVVEQLATGHGDGPLALVGHSLGAAVALAAPTRRVSAILLVSPGGLMRLRVPGQTLAATVPWVARPTADRSARLLRQLAGPGARPDADLAEWMTLVSRHTRPVLAPAPLPDPILQRWTRTPRQVLCGEHDCFLPLPQVDEHARQRLGVPAHGIPGAGHLLVDQAPDLIADAAARLI